MINPETIIEQTGTLEHGSCAHCGESFDGGLIWQTFMDRYNDEAKADEVASHYGADRTKGRWRKSKTLNFSDGKQYQICPSCNRVLPS